MNDRAHINLDFGTSANASNGGVSSEYFSPREVSRLETAVKTVDKAERGELKVQVSKARRITKGNEFAMVFYQNISKLLVDGKLNITKADIVVLFKLLEYTKLGNLLAYSQTQLSKEIGVSRQAVNRSMKSLRDKKVIIVTERGEFFNPLIVCKGSYESVAKDVMFEARKPGDDTQAAFDFYWEVKE
jgi:biotin operon repressor